MLAVSALGDGLLFLIRLHNCLVSFSVALLSSLDLALAIRSPISRDSVSASIVLWAALCMAAHGFLR